MIMFENYQFANYRQGCGTLKASGGDYGGGSENLILNDDNNKQYVVRRLTPLECERLQGFPDNWTQIGEVVDYERYTDPETGEEFVQAIYEYIDENGKKKRTSDSARYKALGNSIAIPPWTYVLQRLSVCCGTEATMASLFDGIGGFPLIWERINGKGSCLWASEIEDFPIAVTKYHFPEEVPDE